MPIMHNEPIADESTFKIRNPVSRSSHSMYSIRNRHTPAGELVGDGDKKSLGPLRCVLFSFALHDILTKLRAVNSPLKFHLSILYLV